MENITDKNLADKVTLGTYYVGDLNGITYKQLIKILGEPIYDTASGDEKVQKMWVVEFDSKYFTIYDWKTYDLDYTINENTDWHIGGTEYAGDFEYEFLRLIDKIK